MAVRSSIRRAGTTAVIGLFAGAGAVGLLTPSAWADGVSAPVIFWTTPNNLQHNSGHIFFARLNGSSTAPRTLTTTGATVNSPLGVAPDPAGGKVYWANAGANTIAWARLNGTGGGSLNTAGATVDIPTGLVVDRHRGKIYWANSGGGISWAHLNGSGGGDLVTTGATVNHPAGVAIDTQHGRIYWANSMGNSISYAALNNSGGADLVTTGATVDGPQSVVISSSLHRIYWANFSGNSIGYASLSGGNGGNLATTGANISSPILGAIDPATGRLYWANYGTPFGIMYANLDSSGHGGTLYTVSNGWPAAPAILTKPAGAGVPRISGGSRIGDRLSCSRGRWRSDLPGEHDYRAPAHFGYRWTRNGSALSGATARTYTPRTGGSYRCIVTARNAAGKTSQTSATTQISSS
jgi:DNA-binding beta-propeller fold protein YncE